MTKIHRNHDAGSGTVTMIATLAVALTLLTGTATLNHAAIAAAKSAAAADLAALAAADAARGLMLSEPCVLAERTATRHGAQLVTCEIADGGIARVTTTVETRLPIWNATGEARAGPPPSGAAVVDP
ncbi:MAG: Rv3654c family TadE-like protein [Micrococcaceae bacterium]